MSVSNIGGELPYEMVENNGTVVLRYCCRGDGNPAYSVILPDKYPYMLIKVMQYNFDGGFGVILTTCFWSRCFVSLFEFCYFLIICKR